MFEKRDIQKIICEKIEVWHVKDDKEKKKTLIGYSWDTPIYMSPLIFIQILSSFTIWSKDMLFVFIMSKKINFFLLCYIDARLKRCVRIRRSIISESIGIIPFKSF